MEIEIIDMDHLGNGLGKINGKIVFVPKSITGDICIIKITKETPKYSYGIIEKIIKPSKLRIPSTCPYYKICGGCNISNLSYSEQLQFKKNKVTNIFKKYLGLDLDITIIGSKKEWQYRNKITLHKDKTLGLISTNLDVFSIESCHLVSNNINNLIKAINKKDLSKVKLVTIRECSNGLILNITGSLDYKDLTQLCIEININNRCVYQREQGYIMLNDLKFVISNNSFFQINTSNITTLYDEIVKLGNFNQNDNVIDLYCGVGSISLYISKYVKSVYGVEIVPDGIKDAKQNAKINNIANAKFICSDVSKIIDSIPKGNKLIVDPPRTGLDKHTRKIINNSQIPVFIYVSCDIMTLVRDLKELSNYHLQKVEAVDMFPNTHHVESIVLLSLKK